MKNNQPVICQFCGLEMKPGSRIHGLCVDTIAYSCECGAIAIFSLFRIKSYNKGITNYVKRRDIVR